MLNNQPFFSWRQAILKSDLPAVTRHVLLTLSCHMNDAGESCYPSIELLCEETGLSNRTVITHLQEAATRGWIVVTKHGYAGQRWARNEYQISWPKTVNQGSNTEEKVVKEVHCLEEEGSEGGSLPLVEGSEPDDIKAVKEVHTNSSKNSPEEVTNVTSPVLVSEMNKIDFDPWNECFVNISDEQMARWESAYPGVDIDAELTRAEEWYLANPKKWKKNKHRFLVGWFSRAHERLRAPKGTVRQQGAARL